MQVLIGQTLGPYHVHSVIGEGGMGVVYLGEHPTIGRMVALKVLRPELSLRDDLVERFIQEARAVNTIGHANIVNIYDFGKTPFGSFYIVMEHMEGENLRDLVQQEGPQPLDRVRTTVRGVGAALGAAHAKGFIHRDVKPENIMLVNRAGKQFAKLLDFGIVKLLTDQPTFHTQWDSAVGTPQYMSPEQLEQGALDHRADIYSLGAVVYEMLTGNVPYPGRTGAEVRQLQLTQTPPPPSAFQIDNSISRDLDACILWALSLNPANRCSSMVDFLSAFEEGYHSSKSESSRPRSQGLLTSSKNRIVAAIGIGLLAIGCGSIVALLVLPSRDNPGASVRKGDGSTAAARPGPDARARAEARPEERARSILLAAQRSKKPQTRVKVVTLIGEGAAPLLLKELVAALEDPNPSVRRAAARALGQSGDRSAVAALRKALPESVGYGAVDIAAALGSLGDPSGIARLKQELSSAREDFKRKYVLHALGKLGQKEARGWRQLLAGSRLIDASLRLKALGYLALLKDPRATRELLRALGADWPIRIQAAEALLPTAPERAKKVLREALRAAPGADRARAATLLARFGDVESLEVLIEFLSAADPELKKSSALALGYYPGTKARDHLVKAMDDPVEEVRLAACVALLRLKGR